VKNQVGSVEEDFDGPSTSSKADVRADEDNDDGLVGNDRGL